MAKTPKPIKSKYIYAVLLGLIFAAFIAAIVFSMQSGVWLKLYCLSPKNTGAAILCNGNTPAPSSTVTVASHFLPPLAFALGFGLRL